MLGAFLLEHVERSLGGQVQQCLEFDGALCGVVDGLERVGVVVGDVFVKLVVLLLFDFALRAHPNCLHRVERFLGDGRLFFRAFLRLALVVQRGFVSDDVHHDRVLHEVGIFLYNLTEPEFHDVIPAALVEVQGDLGAALVSAALGDFVSAVAARFPRPRLVTGGGAGFERHLVGDHERGVKPDAELADQLRLVLGVAFLQFLHELARAGAGDSADVFLEFLLGHADAVVLDPERLGLVVHEELDAELRVVLHQFLV